MESASGGSPCGLWVPLSGTLWHSMSPHVHFLSPHPHVSSNTPAPHLYGLTPTQTCRHAQVHPGWLHNEKNFKQDIKPSAGPCCDSTGHVSTKPALQTLTSYIPGHSWMNSPQGAGARARECTHTHTHKYTRMGAQLRCSKASKMTFLGMRKCAG